MLDAVVVRVEGDSGLGKPNYKANPGKQTVNQPVFLGGLCECKISFSNPGAVGCVAVMAAPENQQFL